MRAALELERRSPNRRVDARQDWNRADSEIGAPIAQLTRRAFLGRSAFGLGALGLASLLNENLFAGVSRTASTAGLRSKLHTSELQSRLHLVCRLLLEKKKKTKLTHPYRITITYRHTIHSLDNII